MGNHHIDCDYCNRDTRGPGAVKGCSSKEEAKGCIYRKEIKCGAWPGLSDSNTIDLVTGLISENYQKPDRYATVENAMQIVRQQDAYGCVLACIAMVCGRSYEQVQYEIGPVGRGFGHHVWQEYLNRQGFASQLVFRHDCIAKADRTPWPLAPWADLHLCSVDAGHGFGSHLIVLLKDGTVLDPMRNAPGQIGEYSGFAYMAAVFPVRAAPQSFPRP